MTISYIFEGPKGSGKSTMVNYVANELNHKIREWSPRDHDPKGWAPDGQLKYSEFISDVKDSDMYVHARGFMSYAIYRWVQNYETSIKSTHVFTELYAVAHVPLTRKHFEFFLDNIQDKLVIFYASNEKDLFARIENRNKEIGKGATDEEWAVLGISNQAYQFFGKMLSYLRPDKVIMIDISNPDEIDQFKQSIK